MTTQDQPEPFDAFFTNNAPEISEFTADRHPDPGIALIRMGRAGEIYLRSPAAARQLVSAAVQALVILNPSEPLGAIRAALAPAEPGPPPGPGLAECGKCHLIGTPADMDPVTWASLAGGESGTHWYCKDMTACSDRAVPGLAEHLKQAAVL